MSNPTSKTFAPVLVTPDVLAQLIEAKYVLPVTWPEPAMIARDMNSATGWKVETTDDGTIYVAPSGTKFVRAAHGALPHLIGLSTKASPVPLTLLPGETKPDWFPARGMKKGGSTPKAPAGPREIGFEAKAKDEITVARAGSKRAIMIDALHKGTTLEALTKAMSQTGKPVNARAWLSYDLRCVGYGVREENGKLYLVLPKGMKEPLAHKVAEEKAEPKKAEPKKAETKKAKGKKVERLTKPAPKPSAKKVQSRKPAKKAASSSLKAKKAAKRSR